MSGYLTAREWAWCQSIYATHHHHLTSPFTNWAQRNLPANPRPHPTERSRRSMTIKQTTPAITDGDNAALAPSPVAANGATGPAPTSFASLWNQATDTGPARVGTFASANDLIAEPLYLIGVEIGPSFNDDTKDQAIFSLRMVKDVERAREYGIVLDDLDEVPVFLYSSSSARMLKFAEFLLAEHHFTPEGEPVTNLSVASTFPVVLMETTDVKSRAWFEQKGFNMPLLFDDATPANITAAAKQLKARLASVTKKADRTAKNAQRAERRSAVA